jgi:5-methylcytosine-specific restriction protein A
VPFAAPRPCLAIGCATLVRGRSRCPVHERARERNKGSAHSRGYDARWRKARLLFLQQHPLCRRCEADGQVVPATVVDHVVPHRGDHDLFWDSSNWQPLCVAHHTEKTNTEDGGFGNPRKGEG